MDYKEARASLKSSGPSEGTCKMFLNDVCVRELCGVANGLLMGESMPESWKRSTIVPLYKGKGNVLECGNYHTIKLLEHGMNVVECVFMKRLRNIIEIRAVQRADKRDNLCDFHSETVTGEVFKE